MSNHLESIECYMVNGRGVEADGLKLGPFYLAPIAKGAALSSPVRSPVPFEKMYPSFVVRVAVNGSFRVS